MERAIVYKHDNGLLKLPHEVITEISAFRQTTENNLEAGGILLGRLIIDTNDIVIDYVTSPMNDDKRSRFGFFRAEQPHQSILFNKWESSFGTCNYLGEWHTHPEPVPKPSNRDIRSWQAQCQKLPKGRNCLYFVIVGTETLTVWKAKRRPFTIQQLKQL